MREGKSVARHDDPAVVCRCDLLLGDRGIGRGRGESSGLCAGIEGTYVVGERGIVSVQRRPMVTCLAWRGNGRIL